MRVDFYRTMWAAVALGAVALTGGCSQKAKDPDPSAEAIIPPPPSEASNAATDAPMALPDDAPPAPAPTVEPAAPPEKIVIPPERPLSRHEQMLDDADATGLTAPLAPSADAPGNGNSNGNGNGAGESGLR